MWKNYKSGKVLPQCPSNATTKWIKNKWQRNDKRQDVEERKGNQVRKLSQKI